MVARQLWELDVAGSSPAGPTNPEWTMIEGGGGCSPCGHKCHTGKTCRCQVASSPKTKKYCGCYSCYCEVCRESQKKEDAGAAGWLQDVQAPQAKPPGGGEVPGPEAG